MNSSTGQAGPLPERIEAIVRRVFDRFAFLEESRAGLMATYKALVETFSQGGVVYLCGNGGSFADAVHIKGELGKRFKLDRPIRDTEVIENLKGLPQGEKILKELDVGLPVIVLGESHSLRSAAENDGDPTLAYAQELNSFTGCLPGGALLGISTSGNAQNVIAAMTLAKAYRMTTISFTGPQGGQLAPLSDIDWRVVGDTTAQVQENQLPLYHALCEMLEAHFFG